MSINHILTEILTLSCSGIIVVLTSYILLRNQLTALIKRPVAIEADALKREMIQLKIQAHERMLIFIDRINPSSLFLRVHQPGISVAALQSVILNDIRAEYQHNITQQLYLSAETWSVISKLKDDTLAMIANAARLLPEDAQGLDLSRKVLQHMAAMENNPYELTVHIIKKDLQQLF